MTKNFCLNLLLALSTLSLTLPTLALSRYNDGDARAWIQENQLCLGVSETYKVGGLFLPRNARTDENEVRLYGVYISRNNDTNIWDYSNQTEKTPGPLLTSNTCIAYDEKIKGFAPKVPAKRLEAGIYSIMLLAEDSKGRRAWFNTTFCLKGSPAAWSAGPAKVNENEVGFARWYCD